MLKFKRVQFSGIDGQPKTRQVEVKEAGIDGFSIEASGVGIKVKGEMTITMREDLQPFAKAVADAWKDHVAFRPKLNTNLAGH